MTHRAIWEELNRPPELLEQFQLWLEHRAHRPEEFEDAAACEEAWQLVQAYRHSLWGRVGK